MRIEMITRYAGPLGNVGPGKIINVPNKDAEELIEGGYAKRIGSEGSRPKLPEENQQPTLETAAEEPGEDAEMPPPRRRRRKTTDT